MAPRKYSIIVFGATGFTGQLVAEYLAQNAPKEATFAIAGRSQTKLDEVSSRCKSLAPSRFPNGVPSIVADSDDQTALDNMVKQASCVITTVGPYDKYGWKLVDACVRLKTDYVDLCGEPQFHRGIIDKYHDTAVKNGVLIIPACGFDSIPSDLGTFMLADHFKEKGQKLSAAQLTVTGMSGTASGGTLASLLNVMESLPYKKLFEMGNNPDYLLPDSIPNNKIQKMTTLTYNKAFKKWQFPFVMEATNLKVVRRSAGLLDYASTFQYGEGMSAPNVIVAFIATIVMAIGAFLFLFPPVRYMAKRILPAGTGPSEKQRENGFFAIRVNGESVNARGESENAIVSIKAKGDPGYKATSMMIAESALCLALERKRCATPGETGHFKSVTSGIATPASAMGQVLVERLRAAGMTWDLKE